MQSTGHTSTHAVSLVSIQGSVITKGIEVPPAKDSTCDARVLQKLNGKKQNDRCLRARRAVSSLITRTYMRPVLTCYYRFRAYSKTLDDGRLLLRFRGRRARSGHV